MNYHGAYDHLRQQLREAQRELTNARTAIRNLASNSFGEARSINVGSYDTHDVASQRAAYETANAYWNAHERLSGLAGHLCEALAYDDGYEAAAPGDDENDVAWADTARALHEPLPEPLPDPIAQSEWIKQGGLAELTIIPGYAVTVTAITEDSGDIRLSILNDANRRELAELLQEALTSRHQKINIPVDPRVEKLNELGEQVKRINHVSRQFHIVQTNQFASLCVGTVLDAEPDSNGDVMLRTYHEGGASVRKIEIKADPRQFRSADSDQVSEHKRLRDKHAEQVSSAPDDSHPADQEDEEAYGGDFIWARSAETGLWTSGQLPTFGVPLTEETVRIARESGMLVDVQTNTIRSTKPPQDEIDQAVEESFLQGKGK